MRIASFNVENLFQRAVALNQPTWEEGRKALGWFAAVNQLLTKTVYSAADRKRIVELLTNLGLDKSDEGREFARLRQNKGDLLKRSKQGSKTIIEIVASGRPDWVGSVELKTEPVNELATQHTAMVIRDVDPDVVGVVEVENRPVLRDFSRVFITAAGGTAFHQVMVIDGNDDRGIDVGLGTKRGFEIETIRSHVDDADADGAIFSRDCPEFTIRLAGPTGQPGERVVVLLNHLKSKGFGSQADNDKKRRRQATRVAEICSRLSAEGETNLVVMGDFNDVPDSDALKPLLTNTGLNDISTHPAFDDDGRPGTFGNGTKRDKIDYILLSPALFAKVTGGGVFRKGAWGGKNGTLWEHYDTMTAPVHAASDHAALFADIAL